MIAQIEGVPWAARFKPHPVLCCEIGKTAGDVHPAGKNHAFDLRADRRQRRADAVATIEQRREPSLRDRLARRGNERRKPPRPGIAAGIRRAGEHNRPIGAQRRRQRGNGVVERMDDNSDRLSV